MRAEVYWIPGPWPGRLGILPRPRGGDWLEDEVRSWRASGIEVVVSLLTSEEIAEFELQEEETLSRAGGVDFHSLPIPDRGVPRSRTDWMELVSDLESELGAGKTVVVHCRQGIGRSALVVAALLVAAGQGPAEAFRHIETVRGRPVPETIEQREWVT
jgi:protein-tyrosine phosphatase